MVRIGTLTYVYTHIIYNGGLSWAQVGAIITLRDGPNSEAEEMGYSHTMIASTSSRSHDDPYGSG